MDREKLEVDVVIVGAGPGGLSCAYALMKRLKEKEPSREYSVAVLEKSAELGAHILSGAVLDPRALQELIPDHKEKGFPIEATVEKDAIYYLTPKRKWRIPNLLPPLHNEGFYITSLNEGVQWLGRQCESVGVSIFTGFTGAELLYEGDRVIGVRTGDKGVDKHGGPKSNYEQGIDIHAKITVLAEGPRGSLTKPLIQRFHLDEGRNPQVYAVGIKEVWRMAHDLYPPGTVFHTMGYPLGKEAFGGGFLYTMKDRLLSLGLVVGLDYENPLLEPFYEFQKFKNHPFVCSLIEGGEVLSYGAKSIPEGGYYSVIRPYGNGCLIIGDSAGFLNIQRLKGIHLAMKSGMLAAETAEEALAKNDFSEDSLGHFQDKVKASWIEEELYPSRNFRQTFQQSGLKTSLFRVFLQYLFGGRDWADHLPTIADHRHTKKLYELEGTSPEPRFRWENAWTFNKLTDVYHSKTNHQEDQPCHLKVLEPDVCVDRCIQEYGNPCQYFCPAQVYEMVGNGQGGLRLQINFANCVHCKTCDIADPYQIINWTTPEGGDGPKYYRT